jgi:hypothetical protein
MITATASCDDGKGQKGVREVTSVVLQIAGNRSIEYPPIKAVITISERKPHITITERKARITVGE